MVSCYGESDAAIDISVSGGSGEYTYNWSNGSVTQDINNLSTQRIFCYTTDENDCTVSIEVEITEPEELIISSELSNISCYVGSDGSIDLTVSGGVTPYNYFGRRMVKLQRIFQILVVLQRPLAIMTLIIVQKL